MKKWLTVGMSVTAAMCFQQANALEFGAPIAATVQTNEKIRTFSGQFEPVKKQVMLMNLKLTSDQKHKLFNPALMSRFNSVHSLDAGMPSKTLVSMNGVPVLDQGRHGSCVTFAVTAALDALIGKGDYVSQLCNLELGSYLAQRGYMASGWDGTLAPFVLDQIQEFGFVNLQSQRNVGCSGMKDYPVKDEAQTGTPMSLDEFKSLSQGLEDLNYESLETLYQRMHWSDEETPAKGQALLTAVKKSLLARHDDVNTRLTFATVVFVNHCGVGACATTHAPNDTWSLTNDILNDQNPDIAGHEMVIIGYDDNAVAVDQDGTKHKGLLTLRNSWGVDAGDKGNYYMTYDYFKMLSIEVNEVILPKA